MEIGTRTPFDITPFEYHSELVLSESSPLTGITKYVYELSCMGVSEMKVSITLAILLTIVFFSLVYCDARKPSEKVHYLP